MRHLFKTHLRTFLLAAFMVFSVATYAQQLHFIYIQAENKQPFSVKLNGKYYSSSAVGYIILPKLSDGTYNLEVNFAKNSYPEQTFTVNVSGKDYGYGLKSFGDKGMGLVNYQTSDVVMNNSASPQGANQAAVVTNNSAFGNMLADVVNDKSINTLSATDTVTTANKTASNIAKKGAVKSDASKKEESTPEAIAATDTSALAVNQPENDATTEPGTPDTAASAALDTTAIAANNNNEDAANDNDKDSVAETAVADSTEEDSTGFNTTGVIKAEENVDDKGTELTFIDFNGTHNDTIKAFIPAATEKLPAKTKPEDVNATAAAADSASAKGKVNNPFFEQGKSDAKAPRKTDNDSAAAVTKQSEPADIQPASTTPTNGALVKADCGNMISDGDLNKLKKRIISKTDQNDILETVKKSLRNKCITTDQVKDMGNLFLSDDSRLGFYSTVYPFVYDYGNFASLENTLIDPDFKTRFKSLPR